MKFILTCGGTAGHINPAVAVAGRLRELMPDCDILFIGAECKMEMELVPREGYEIKPLKITNVSRGHGLSDITHNIGTLKNVAGSSHDEKKKIHCSHYFFICTCFCWNCGSGKNGFDSKN